MRRRSSNPEAMTVVGCLTWRPEGRDQVRRHVATAPVAISFDEESFRLNVFQVSVLEAVSIEHDMLDPVIVTSPARIDEIRELADE